MADSSYNQTSNYIFLLAFVLVILSGCSSGTIPCPKIGGGQGFSLFRKKADAGQEGFGQSKKVGYDKNGLMKKKGYKSPKQKPKRFKSV
ncbi:MAG: hypothetical protein M3Q05_03765 [Bacteroidota bacterium]|nr:hypothetical protein [Bacteroidota bacterium]